MVLMPVTRIEFSAAKNMFAAAVDCDGEEFIVIYLVGFP